MARGFPEAWRNSRRKGCLVSIESHYKNQFMAFILNSRKTERSKKGERSVFYVSAFLIFPILRSFFSPLFGIGAQINHHADQGDQGQHPDNAE